MTLPLHPYWERLHVVHAAHCLTPTEETPRVMERIRATVVYDVLLVSIIAPSPRLDAAVAFCAVPSALDKFPPAEALDIAGRFIFNVRSGLRGESPRALAATALCVRARTVGIADIGAAVGPESLDVLPAAPR